MFIVHFKIGGLFYDFKGLYYGKSRLRQLCF